MSNSEKYKSYEVPVFETVRTDTAAFLLAKGFTFTGLERSGKAYAFKFATRQGQTAKAAAAFEKGSQGGVESAVSRKAMENARDTLRAAILEYEHLQALAAPEERY